MWTIVVGCWHRGEGRSLEEGTLIEAARRGNIAVYEGLVLRYQDLAWRTAYLIVGDAAEAEDATQEVFMRAFDALTRFRPGAPFRPWLLRIVVNEARNRRRASTRRRALAVRATARYPGEEVTVLSPEATALAAERRTILLQALDMLREEDRLIIAYRYFFDLFEAEIADALACPGGTVKSRLARALKRLRAMLVADDSTDLLDVGWRGAWHG